MLFALAVLALFRSRSKASTLSCIFFETTGSIDRANELQGPGFVNCKCFGEPIETLTSGVWKELADILVPFCAMTRFPS